MGDFLAIVGSALVIIYALGIVGLGYLRTLGGAGDIHGRSWKEEMLRATTWPLDLARWLRDR
jgi:hypothetical protein